MHAFRSVIVRSFPSELSRSGQREFLRGFRDGVAAERPRVVLDCSKIDCLDEKAVFLLLCCLEEAMKANGDVRLAGLSASAEAVLETARVRRLYELFPTIAEASASFHSHLGETTGMSAASIPAENVA